MNRNYIQKVSMTSVHRQKFIIAPTEQRRFNSQHAKTCFVDQGAFKKNILLNSTKYKSQSQQKLGNPNKTFNFKLKDNLNNVKSTNNTFQSIKPAQQKTEKFKILKMKTDYDANWLKWKKSTIEIADRKFIKSLNTKVSKKSLPFQLKEKQSSQIFNLKHSFRQLQLLRKTVKKAHENNDLIKRLKIQSNEKIKQFFGKYQKLVQQNIK